MTALPHPPGPVARSPRLSRVLEPEVMDSAIEAQDYDRMDHREVNARFVQDLVALSPDLSHTLDVGTGTALIPIELCRREPEARVVAIDLADHMLALARLNVERAALSGVIDLARCDAKSLPYPDRSFRAVISNSIVHHIPVPAGTVAEMARVLAPGGWLMARDLARPNNEQEVAEFVAKYGAAVNARQRALFEASLRAALTLEEARLLLPGATVAMTSDRHWTLVWKKP
jgi:ubiquinone/menaquinone biosynthesis C-methylase UbiE